MRTIVITICIFCFAIESFSQLQDLPFSNVELRVDTFVFASRKNLATIGGETRLYFKYQTEVQECDVRLYTSNPETFESLELLPSADFEVIDSILIFNDEYITFKVRFLSLSRSDFLSFKFSHIPPGRNDTVIYSIPLLPYTETNVELFTDDYQLFIGEEKIYELSSNHIENIQISNLWTGDGQIRYRLSRASGHLYLHLISTWPGMQQANIQIRTSRPFIDSLGQLNYELPPISRTFTVKESRLRFLNTDLDEIILDPNRREGYLIQLDNQPYFSLQETYRIEDQENPGGPLIAEIFTESFLSNGRILCRLRPYSLHSKSDGYLYIKDDDVARFILNFSIIPQTVISRISILREGSDWSPDRSVYPGEEINVRIEGQSLHVGQFAFEGLRIRGTDSLANNDNVAIFRLRIPITINLRNINILHDGQNTGYTLSVKEYQRPREYDYIGVGINEDKIILSESGSVIMAENVIQDVVISFDRDKIDSGGRLFGIQVLDISITIRGKNNELIELKNIENIQVCPGAYSSPRAVFYNSKNCLTGNIELNRYLSKKTYDLEEWSRIIIEIRNRKEAHGGEGFTKNLDIIVKRSWRFDIDVSFPAGLLTLGGTSGGLTGISMAMIAQFSFYEPNRINRFKPFKIGIGFLALDAFNFSEKAVNRDMAMVILGSLYPTRRETKLTFPLYFGGGYKFTKQQFFFMIGPGIRVSI
ncbi:MAG TPA: hypothetical protein VI583_17210 [Cyclobacteriaceae bacterium]|nr:hypothetical protein [Cyclobacteriaceae bacterium]